MGVTHRAHGNARAQVHVALAVRVKDLRPATGMQDERGRPVVPVKVLLREGEEFDGWQCHGGIP